MAVDLISAIDVWSRFNSDCSSSLCSISSVLEESSSEESDLLSIPSLDACCFHMSVAQETPEDSRVVNLSTFGKPDPNIGSIIGDSSPEDVVSTKSSEDCCNWYSIVPGPPKAYRRSLRVCKH